MKLGIRLVKIASLYMLLGLVMGVAMAVSHDFTLSSVHAHITLLGWATMAITGIVYTVLPRCGESRLSAWHFWGHNIGLPVMMISLGLLTYGYTAAEKVIGLGSILVLLSLVTFTVNLYLHGATGRASQG
jgi:cbb3-type cytochrome oxidase subunit 1